MPSNSPRVSGSRENCILLLVELLAILVAHGAAYGVANSSSPLFYVRKDTWSATMLASRIAQTGNPRMTSFHPFVSQVICGGRASQHVSVDISGLDTVWLVVSDNGDTTYDQAIWGDAKLIAEDGSETSLSTLEPVSVKVGWQTLCRDKDYQNKPLRIAGRQFEHGLWAHARSELCYRLNRKYKRFESWVGIDVRAGEEGRVTFMVLDRLDSAVSQHQLEQWQRQVERDFPVEWDWALQDGSGGFCRWLSDDTSIETETRMITRVLDELGSDGSVLRAEFDELRRTRVSPTDHRWLDLYVKACKCRRAIRLRPLVNKCGKIVFVKNFLERQDRYGAHYTYTQALSDGQGDRYFTPGSALCVLEVQEGNFGTVRTLIDDPNGVIRDPAVSYDGKRVLFAWKKSDRNDDFHLYEMDLETSSVRQLTFGLGFADFEGVYLPNDDIVFSSTRCVQTMDCWWVEVDNLYTCDRDGRYLRRLGYDQVHTNFPAVMDDGRVIYTRWEYSDRGQVFLQPLFQMNPDGTGQTEYYGNDSWFPTSILHARGIPGTGKAIGILAGHHTRQTGKLAIIDPAKGRQENSGVQLIAPVRQTLPIREDTYGQDGELFQYPYPLNETEFLVSYSPFGWARKPLLVNIYLMTIDGRRELLVADPEISCKQPILLAPRTRPRARTSMVDYREKTGTYCLHDIYAGPGLAGVPRGTIKRLRVVELEFRAAGIGSSLNYGPVAPPGGWVVVTPVSVNGSWDVKVVLGDAKVYEDGSACFVVPARTPVYFLALDAKGHAVQTMRSWSTLQPGEVSSCVGCHESKNEAPPVTTANMPLALEAGPQPLMPFYGSPRGFSFIQEIQPILDRHCILCHNLRPHSLQPATGDPTVDPNRTPPPGGVANAPQRVPVPRPAFSLLGTQTPEAGVGRKWSDAYLALTQAFKKGNFLSAESSGKFINWISPQSVPSMLPPYPGGAAKSALIAMLEEGHEGVELSREEMDKIACWIDLLVPYCGEYTEANAWSPQEVGKYHHYLRKRESMIEIERKSIEELIAGQETGLEDRGQSLNSDWPKVPSNSATVRSGRWLLDSRHASH